MTERNIALQMQQATDAVAGMAVIDARNLITERIPTQRTTPTLRLKQFTVTRRTNPI